MNNIPQNPKDVILGQLFEDLSIQNELETIFQAITDGVTIQDQFGKFVYANNVAVNIFGLQHHQEILNIHREAFVVTFEILNEQGEYLPLELLLSQRIFERDPDQNLIVLWRNLKTGSERWFEIKSRIIKDSAGKVKFAVSLFCDITLRKQTDSILDRQYNYDPLTGLINRNCLNEKFAKGLQTGSAYKPTALMLIDLDRFKEINESLGHAIGDRLIQSVALRLRSCVGENYVLARIGGDEFGILYSDATNEEDLAKLSNIILENFRHPFYIDDHEIFTSPSIGISMYPHDGQEPAILFKNAETALYRAKAHGRNTFRFYTTTMNSMASERLTMESRLRHAIDNNEFVLYYQPQIHIGSGKIVGVEELIRWQRPDGTIIMPDRFIPLAETNGLIDQIGMIVLKESLREGKIWHDLGHRLTIGVNLSAWQFKQKNFEQIIIRTIEDSKLDPHFVELELTESLLAENLEAVAHTMNVLKDYGVRLCLDDFATGYSSLRYIKEFPVDTIKIERAFMKGTPLDRQNAAIVKSIITLGHSLNMEITAEGVESKSQLSFLRDNGCHRAQGFLFSSPIPAHMLTEILSKDYDVQALSTTKAINGKPLEF